MENLTMHASPERASSEQLEKGFSAFQSNEIIRSFLNTMPDVVAILNKERQLIFGNDVLLNFFGVNEFEKLLGIRPGEALNCVNSHTMPAGCGTSEKCKYCGFVNSVLESQETNQKVTKETRITTHREGVDEFLDLKVTTAPFEFQENHFWIVTMEDISDLNRRAMLERIFFHDILNIVGSLKGVSDLLSSTDKDDESSQKYIGIVNDLSKELLEEIQAQRVMVAAENEELEPKFVEVASKHLLQDAINYLSLHSVAKSKNIQVQEEADDLIFVTDPVLLKRVLVNMLKNSLEASPKGSTIILNCKLKEEFIEFSVHNSGYMVPEVQAQVFQRSFSTKGKGRGLGTYSIKLLTERYLKGVVGFTSDIVKGTEFYIRIPFSKGIS